MTLSEAFESTTVKGNDTPNAAMQDLAGKLFADEKSAPWKKNNQNDSQNVVGQDGQLNFGSIGHDDTSAATIIGPMGKPQSLSRTTQEMNEASLDVRDGMKRTRAVIKEATVDGRTVPTVDADEAKKLGFVVGGGLQGSTFSEVNNDAKTDVPGVNSTIDGRFRDQATSLNTKIDLNPASLYDGLQNANPAASATDSAVNNFAPPDASQINSPDADLSHIKDWLQDLRDLIDRLEHRDGNDGRSPSGRGDWRQGDHDHHRHHGHHHSHHENPQPHDPPTPAPPRDNPPPTPIPPRDVPPPAPTPNPPRDVPPPSPPSDVPPKPPSDNTPPSADLNSAEQRFDSATTNLNATDAAKLKSYRDEMVQGCHDRGVSDTEIAKTLDQTSRLLSTKSSVLDPSSEQQSRVVAAEGILKNAGHPDIYVNQGNHNTCNVTTVEERTYTRAPSRAAEIVTDSLLNGQYTSLDGKTVTLNKDALTPDADSRTNQLQGENSREYASQIFQAGVLTDLGLRNNPPVQYIANGGPGASGEGWETASGQKYSFNGTGIQEIADMNRYTNGDTDVVAAGFSSPQELESWIAQNAGKQPLTIGVNGMDPLFYGDHTRSDGQTGGLNHVVSIEDYDAANHRVKVSNQWGSNMDFWVDVNLLYQAT